MLPGDTAEERIIALFNLVDTSAALRSSPSAFGAFLADLENRRDPVLKRYIDYFREISPVFFEKDGKARIRIYEAAYERFGKSRDSRLQAICLHYIGQENFVLGNYGAAFDKSLQSREILKAIGYENIPEVGKYLHDIALNYYYFRDYEKVTGLMYEALKHRPYSPNLDIQRYNTLALSYRQTGRPDSAASYFRKAAMRSEFYRDSTWITLIAGNLGTIYITRKQYREALPLLLADFHYNRTNDHFPDMARNAALAIADVWLQLNQPDSAIYYLEESERLHLKNPLKDSFGRQQRDEDFLKSYYDILARYYRQLGNYTLAYLYLDSLNKTSLEHDRRYNTMLAKVSEDKLKIQQYVSDIALERQKRRTALVRWMLILAVLLFCIVLLGLLYFLNRARQAKQKALQQLKDAEILSRQKLTMAAFERAKDQLRYQLGLVEEKNLLIGRLKNDLEKLRSGREASPDLLEETLEKLACARLLTQEDWVRFRRRFNAVFNDSLEDLKKTHPDITQSEERIYALIQLDVGTRQMASMLGISPESVRKARYRLNKRLKST
ncbi:MAG: hypothetical protein ABS46_13365 [Cytophagaceae bacterium SCN 52-12]|nr:MAG: hypothetical protein ABS46_13365 [Cytophagaceae bacterium SCN 52-12]